MLGVGIAALSCAPSRRPVTTPTESPRITEGRPDAAAWMGSDATRARTAGASELKIAVVEAAGAGDRVGRMITLPPDSCTLLMARGTETVEDLDLFAYADEGAALGVDETTDPRATVMLCPPLPRRTYAVARVAAGHGLVALGVMTVPVSAAAGVGTVLGARGRPDETIGALAAWRGLDEIVASHRQALGGTWDERRRVAIAVDPRAPTLLTAAVEADTCLHALVLPDPGVSHLDVAVLDAEGRTVGRASARSRERTLVVCSETQTPVTLEVRPHSGKGLAAVVLSRAHRAVQTELDQRAFQFDASPPGDLATSLRALQARLDAGGEPPGKVVARGTATPGRRATHVVTHPGGCSRLDVVAARPLLGMDAWAWTDEQRLLARGSGRATAAIFVCRKRGALQVDVQAAHGTGEYAVELRNEAQVAAALVDHPLAASRLVEKLLSSGLVRGLRQLGAPTLVSLETTRREVMPVTVAVGRCMDVTLALGAGSSGAEVRIVDASSGEELARGSGAHTAGARVCALATGATVNASAEFRVAAGKSDALVATRLIAPAP